MADLSAKQQVRGFLSLIAASLLSAFLIVAFLINYYDGLASYKAGDILISPDLVEQFSYTEATSTSSQYFVGDIQLAKKNERGLYEQRALSAKTYRNFYSLVKNTKSLALSPSLEHDFMKRGAKLYIEVELKSKSEDLSHTRSFQQLEFTQDGKFFRVQLQSKVKNTTWAYFRFDEAKDLLSL